MKAIERKELLAILLEAGCPEITQYKNGEYKLGLGNQGDFILYDNEGYVIDTSDSKTVATGDKAIRYNLVKFVA